MTLVRIYAALAVGMWLMACTGPAPDERPVLIPAPQKTIWGDGTYRLPERLQLGIADTVLIAAAGYVNEVLAPYGTVAVDRCDRGDIVLELDSAALPPEGYRLSVTHAGVRIGGGSYRGVVNGIATLRQLLPAKAGSGAKIPYAEIADRPAFGWRGVMLDVSRHFFDKEEIFTLLDQMARLKLNKFHWHLTDDQGWRIEIPCYPELTQEGAWRLFNRQDTLCMGRAAREQNDDFLLPVRRLRTDGADTLYGGYYTRKDIREVVAYAAVRGIDVIPEIDMPGHMLGALAIACRPSTAIRGWPVSDAVRGGNPSLRRCAWARTGHWRSAKVSGKSFSNFSPMNMFTWVATRSIRATGNVVPTVRPVCVPKGCLTKRLFRRGSCTVCSAFAKPADAA